MGAVRRQLPKLDVAGSIPVSRSKKINNLQIPASPCAPFVLRLHDERRFQLLNSAFPVLH